VLILGAPASATASGSVTQYLGSLGSSTVDPGFAAATATYTKEFIDFDADGFDGLAPHAFTPIPSTHYSAQGVTLLGLDARSVDGQPWAHSPPIGAWQTGFSSPPGPYSFVFAEPVASFGMFANDVEAPVTVTVHLGSGTESFTLPFQGGADITRFHGFVAATNEITQIDFSSADYHIIDDVQFGRTSAGSLQITAVTEDADSVPRYGRFEASIGLSESFSNPFDPDEIAVDARFQSPSGRIQVMPAFWYEPFTASGTAWENYASDGAPGWRVRFAPEEVGTYTYSVTARAGGTSAPPISGSFQSTPSPDRGFVGIDSRNSHFLRYENGDPYIPLGHNLAFEDANPNLNGVGYYNSVLDSFAHAGENWTRIWMTDFNRSALEWGEGHYSGLYHGPGVYSLASAWRMDQILERAEHDGIYVQLVLSDFGQFSNRGGDRWGVRCAQSDPPPCLPGDDGYDPGNAFSDANGGPVPLAHPELAFSDSDARDLMKKRLRYVVARWGSFRSVLAWELMNELQFVGSDAANPYTSSQVRSDLVNWHSDLAGYLKATDPFSHLVTTSSAIQDSDGSLTELNAIWALPSVDLVQIHWYQPQTNDTTRDLSAWIDQLEARYGKPVIVGELGLPGPNPEINFDPTTFPGGTADREHLEEGTYLHNAMWSTAMSRSASMYWWWGNYIASDATRHRTSGFPLNERLVPPLGRFMQAEDWAPLTLAPAPLSVSGPIKAVGSSGGDHAYIWVRDEQNEYGTGARPGDLVPRTITSAALSLPMNPGTYRVRVYDTWGSAGVTHAFTTSSSGGTVTVAVPAFTRDVAVKIDPVLGSPLGDSDRDGIDDGIDTGTGTFDDGHGTYGSLALPVPSGLTVLVEDVSPNGVRLRVSGSGTNEATFATCGYPGSLQLGAGSVLDVTCGSVLVHVTQGNARYVLPQQETTVTMAQGATAKFDRNATGTPTIQNQGGGTVSVTTAGVTTTVQPGTTSNVLTPNGLCALTRQYVQSAGKYQGAKPGQRNAPDALVTNACRTLGDITPTTKLATKKSLIAQYKGAIDSLVSGGWLTTVQATRLKALADTL